MRSRKSMSFHNKTYDVIEKISAVAANPQNAERFLSFPGARDLSEHPKIIAFRNDQENLANAWTRAIARADSRSANHRCRERPGLRARLKNSI